MFPIVAFYSYLPKSTVNLSENVKENLRLSDAFNFVLYLDMEYCDYRCCCCDELAPNYLEALYYRDVCSGKLKEDIKTAEQENQEQAKECMKAAI